MSRIRLRFVQACYLVGVVADLAATIPLLSPRAAEVIFGLARSEIRSATFLYCSRVAASLMAGWTLLLLWGFLRPIERRGVLLLTIAPVLAGLIASSVAVVGAGAIEARFMIPMWVFYSVVTPAYAVAYAAAAGAARTAREEDARDVA
jgi:hypothetical protein